MIGKFKVLESANGTCKVLKTVSGSCKSSATTKNGRKLRKPQVYRELIHSKPKKALWFEIDNYSTRRKYRHVSDWFPRKYCRAVAAYSCSAR